MSNDLIQVSELTKAVSTNTFEPGYNVNLFIPSTFLAMGDYLDINQ